MLISMCVGTCPGEICRAQRCQRSPCLCFHAPNRSGLTTHAGSAGSDPQQASRHRQKGRKHRLEQLRTVCGGSFWQKLTRSGLVQNVTLGDNFSDYVMSMEELVDFVDLLPAQDFFLSCFTPRKQPTSTCESLQSSRGRTYTSSDPNAHTCF